MESTDQLGNADDPVFTSSSTLNNHLRDKRQNKRSKDHHGIDHSNNQSTSSLEKLINSGSYIDHRNQSDLAHLHSSPARSRRRNNGSVFKRSNLGNSDNVNNHNNYNNNNNDNNNNNNNNINSNNAGSPNSGDGNIPPRRPSNLPLTNRNLQHLLRSSVSAPGAAESTTPDAVALDMDQFAREQSRLARSHSWTDPFGDGQGQGQNQSLSYGNGNGNGKEYGRNDSYTGNGDFDNYSVNSLEFGESNPSSDHSSDSTSLDDVWHFDREEIKRDEWPNLDILEEFVKEEYEIAERENDQGINTEQSVNFGAHHRIHDEGVGTRTGARAATEGGAAAVVGTGSYSPRLHNDRKQQQQQQPSSSSSSPPQQQQQQQNKDVGVDEDDADENTPLIENFQSNDLESLNSLSESFRVRPTPTQPWEKSKDQIPTILNRNSTSPNQKNRNQKDGEVCRYTYFREDLPKTIYSPTIGGLLSDDPKLSIHDRLVELFRPGTRSFGDNSTISHKQQDSLSSTNLQSQQQIQTQTQTQPQPQTQLQSQTPTLTHALSQAQAQSLKPGRIGNETPLPLSINGEIVNDPFWLDVLDPTEEEMKVISRTFGIHPLTTEDIFLGEAREKVELFRLYYFICFTSFDVVYERRKQKAKEQEKKYNKLQEMYENASDHDSLYGQYNGNGNHGAVQRFLSKAFGGLFKGKKKPPSIYEKPQSSSMKSKGKRIREGELAPLNMYMIVFKNAVISFHFSPTPHPINVRRRARMLKDYLTVSSDWICYALIDDITDSFAPMIETIETEVNSIEDAILRMHSGENEDSDDSDDEEDDGASQSIHQHTKHPRHVHNHHSQHQNRNNERENVFVWRKRSKSMVEPNPQGFYRMANTKSKASSSSSSTSDTGSSHILGWKRKGDMLRRIGECRKRVMSVLRLLSSKADVIKGFSKRFNDVDTGNYQQLEIAMYLGDIQDHIVTMIQALNHYEKLLARFHLNYLAQINIDMTKVNNDTNDVLGKITILGTIVLPINVVTGLWGMNCLVPGQDYDGLLWFWCIVGAMALFSIFAYHYARRVTGL